MIDLLIVIAVYVLVALVFCIAVELWMWKHADEPSILLGDDDHGTE